METYTKRKTDLVRKKVRRKLVEEEGVKGGKGVESVSLRYRSIRRRCDET